MNEQRYHHRIRTAKERYLEQGEPPEGVVSESIQRSWERCLKQGLINDTSPQLEPTTSSHLNFLRDQNALLIEHTQSEFESLYAHIAGTQSMIILSDANGIILNATGNADFMTKAQRVALQPGVSWNESITGTNAIGTALIENRPILVKGAEHYLERNGFLNCSASPIHDPTGNIIGVLDLSGDYRQPHEHTLSLIRMSVQLIENRLFQKQFKDDFVIHFHTRPEYIGTLWEGIAVFSPEGKLLAANQSGIFQLGIPASNYIGTHLENVFEVDLAGLIVLGRKTTLPHPNKVRLRNGNSVFVSIDIPQQALRQTFGQYSNQIVTPQESPFKALESLDSGDEKIHVLIDKLKQAINHEIPIIIEGETGTGKELFAQAIHHSSLRKNGPFVAINCAAIPEGLIESELFGHEEGAFTGARKRGSPGRIQQANGGTLFLDEIGEMPLAMQARLLRVMQSKEVTPLGSTKSLKVDITIISATNVSLKEQISKKLFREDLYYRLNGYKISLPPLRLRTDMATLIQRILRDQLNKNGVLIDAEVIELFQQYSWPGNIRQLFHILQTASIFMTGNILRKQNLPDDFLEEVSKANQSKRFTNPHFSTPFATTDEHHYDMNRLERELITEAIKANFGNIGGAAKKLGISRATLYRKIKKWGISPQFWMTQQ